MSLDSTTSADSPGNSITLCGHRCFDPESKGNVTLIPEINSVAIELHDYTDIICIGGKNFRVFYPEKSCLGKCAMGSRVLIDIAQKRYCAQIRSLADVTEVIAAIHSGTGDGKFEDEE